MPIDNISCEIDCGFKTVNFEILWLPDLLGCTQIYLLPKKLIQ